MMKNIFAIIGFIIITILLVPVIYAIVHFTIFMFILMTAAAIAASLVLYISEEVLK